MQALLAVGADIDVQNNDGWTALMCAVQEGHTKIVRKGANVNAANKYGDTALMSALSPDSYKIQTALMWAAQEGDTEIQILLSAGANVNAQSDC